MENRHDNLIQQLESNRPTLSNEDKANLWRVIASETIGKEPTPSPYTWLLAFKKPAMAPITFVLVLLLGTTGLVAASEPTRPGDSLFAVKQATENIRLALASKDAETRLEAEFAAERLLELSSILEETLTEYRRNNATGSIDREDEKRINTALDTTLSYISKTKLPNDTKDTLYKEAAFLLSNAPIRIDNQKLKPFKNKPHFESPEDKEEKHFEGRTTNDGIRIYKPVDQKDDDYKEIDAEDEEDKREEDKKPSRTHDGTNETDDDSSENIHENENLYTETEDEPENSINQDSPTEDSTNEPFKNSSNNPAEDESPKDNNEVEEGEISIEAIAEEGKAKVKVEQKKNDNEFTLPFTTKAALITAIALKTGLTEALIADTLDLEIKD